MDLLQADVSPRMPSFVILVHIIAEKKYSDIFTIF